MEALGLKERTKNSQKSLHRIGSEEEGKNGLQDEQEKRP